MLGGIVSLFVIICIIAYLVSDYKKEKAAYNSGICPKCGSKLYWSDLNEFKSRLNESKSRKYKCQDCDYSTWVSYKKIDKI